MVGGPGRSKACHACRKRRIACRKEQPECSNCQKAGLSCPGYVRERIFIHAGLPEDGSKTVTLQRYKPLPDKGLVQGARKSTPAEPMLPGLTSFDIHSTFAVAAQRQQLLGRFLSRYELTPGTPRPSGGYHWLTALNGRPMLSRALDVAAIAFCTAKLGRESNDRSLSMESRRLYGSGLRELQRALYDPAQMYSDDTLGACVLLAMYEACECPSGSYKGYSSHVAGSARLIQLRGPEAHADGLGHLIFSSFRFIATLESLATKQTFLADPAWMTIPFSCHPKSAIGSLLDLILEAPAILQKTEIFQQGRPLEEQLRAAIEILQSCLALDVRRCAFYDDFIQDIPDSKLYAETPVIEDSFQTHTLFSTVYTFPNIYIAGTVMLYWAFVSLLHNGIRRLVPLVGHLRSMLGVSAQLSSDLDEMLNMEKLFGDATSEPPTSVSPLETLLDHSSAPSSKRELELDRDARVDHQSSSYGPSKVLSFEDYSDFAMYGRRVCRGAQYCLKATETDLSLGALIAPLHMILDIFRSYGDTYRVECDWIQRILDGATDRGLALAAFLDNAGD